jgi:hypothetical protein
MYLFICVLFNDGFNDSHYTSVTSNDGIIMYFICLFIHLLDDGFFNCDHLAPNCRIIIYFIHLTMASTTNYSYISRNDETIMYLFIVYPCLI